MQLLKEQEGLYLLTPRVPHERGERPVKLIDSLLVYPQPSRRFPLHLGRATKHGKGVGGKLKASLLTCVQTDGMAGPASRCRKNCVLSSREGFAARGAYVKTGSVPEKPQQADLIEQEMDLRRIGCFQGLQIFDEKIEKNRVRVPFGKENRCELQEIRCPRDFCYVGSDSEEAGHDLSFIDPDQIVSFSRPERQIHEGQLLQMPSEADTALLGVLGNACEPSEIATKKFDDLVCFSAILFLEDYRAEHRDLAVTCAYAWGRATSRYSKRSP